MTGGIRIGTGIKAADKGCRHGSRHGSWYEYGDCKKGAGMVDY